MSSVYIHCDIIIPFIPNSRTLSHASSSQGYFEYYFLLKILSEKWTSLHWALISISVNCSTLDIYSLKLWKEAAKRSRFSSLSPVSLFVFKRDRSRSRPFVNFFPKVPWERGRIRAPNWPDSLVIHYTEFVLVTVTGLCKSRWIFCCRHSALDRNASACIPYVQCEFVFIHPHCIIHWRFY